jgi:hypothetical protein
MPAKKKIHLIQVDFFGRGYNFKGEEKRKHENKIGRFSIEEGHIILFYANNIIIKFCRPPLIDEKI